MSTAPYSQSASLEHHTCVYCDNEYREDKGYNKKYCSWKCKTNAGAHGILTNIQFDHRFCASCFRKLKDVDAPGRTLNANFKDVFGDADEWGHHHEDKRMGGFTGREEGAPEEYEWGLGEQFDRDPLVDDWEAKPTGYLDMTKQCECGVSHHATIAYGVRRGQESKTVETFLGEEREFKNFRQNLSKSELNRRADRLCDVLDQLKEEEQHDETWDRAALFAYLDDLKDKLPNKGRDYEILERSLGYAIRRAQ